MLFRSRTVLAKESSGKQLTYTITTEHGSVRATDNHRWLGAQASRSKGWFETRQLKVGHKLYYHPIPEVTGEKLNSAVAYMMGYYMGDGCAYNSGRTHEITFQFAVDRYDSKQVNKISKVMQDMGTNPILRPGHGNCMELRCRSKELVRVFQIWKKPHEAPVIPDIIWNADLVGRSAFMAGWMDSDGYFGEDSWKLCNKHESTRIDICRLLDTMGLHATINGLEVRLSSYQKKYIHSLLSSHSSKLPDDVGERTTSEIPSTILSIEEGGTEEVWDIQIDEVEEFIADGYVSHNSAIWAGLNWAHPDCEKFIQLKDWSPEVRRLKEKDFNFPATLDGTNISVLLDDAFLEAIGRGDERARSIYKTVVRQMVSTAEPGFSIDVGRNAGETLRNACTEVTSHDDSDICNLGSINMARISSLEEFREVTQLATLFLLAGTLYSDLPYEKVGEIRERNRRLGLGLMGVHEWLLQRGIPYGEDEQLGKWMEEYARSTEYAHDLAGSWGISAPVKTRALAPTGTIGIVGETTTGIEPIFCVAFRRRYLSGRDWHYQYVVDPTAKRLIDGGVSPDSIEDSYTLAEDIERRIKFQAWMQDYVDHGISSTINLPAWGSELNNESTLAALEDTLLRYIPRLRGVTCYPDGCRGGQPLTRVSYETAIRNVGQVFVEAQDICDITKSGSCGT